MTPTPRPDLVIPPELLDFNLADWPSDGAGTFDGYGAIWIEMGARDRQQRARDAWCRDHGINVNYFARLASEQRAAQRDDS